MKYIAQVFFVTSLLTAQAHGQVTITAQDMFTQPGEYFIAYSNEFDATSLNPTRYAVPSNLAGSAGPEQFWDFSSGPTDVEYRFDYVAPSEVAAGVIDNFPLAKVVERQTNLESGKEQYLFFEQVPGLGRRVYGFYSENPLFDPANVFLPPIVDFPEQIRYGDEWTTTTSWENTIGGIAPPDPEDPDDDGSFSIAARTTHTSTLKADAWGTIVLPDELGGFGQGLRIRAAVTIDVGIEDGSGGFQHVETNYALTYYWFMPGRGMVAVLASTQTATPTPENFPTATQFWRMFQTNKKPAAVDPGGCTEPTPVQDLKIRFNAGQVLLTWGKADCAGQYQLMYSTNILDANAWVPLGNTVTNQLFVLDNARSDGQRFYRVTSMK